MSAQAIRLSPSGPVITGPGGGPFAPGGGARVRLVQGNCTGGQQQIPIAPVAIGPVLGTSALVISLENPNPDYQYRAKVECDVSNPSTVQSTVTLIIDTSEDGALWVQAASNIHFVNGGGAASNGARKISCDLILTPGASIGVTASPQSPRLYVRGRISGVSAGGTPLLMLLNSAVSGLGDEAGTILLELEETL